MDKKYFLFSLIIIELLTSCLQSNLSIDGLPVIDVTKNYPEKEIILSDIANITYLHLNSDNNDFLYKGTIKYITENAIVVNDVESGSVLFFSKDGIPKFRFNRYGNGPEEYLRVHLIVYDETTDDVFISIPFINHIMEVQTVGYEYFGDKGRMYYIRDKKTGKVYSQKILLSDYKGKTIVIKPDINNYFHENGMHIELDLIELKRAYRENKLSGKLNELVAV